MLRTERADRERRFVEWCFGIIQRNDLAAGYDRKRNPTAVQSGNRHATPLGERRRENRRRQTVCVERVARQTPR